MLQNLNTKRLLIILFLGFIMMVNYKLGYDRCNNKWNKKVLNEYITKQEATYKIQKEINKISKEYQEKLSEIEGSTDRVINDLNTANKRLRVKVSNTSRQQQDNSRCFPNGKAELDSEFSRRLIRVTQKGDLWIEALQDTIRQMQQDNHKEVKH